jgi:hypothetical protein
VTRRRFLASVAALAGATLLPARAWAHRSSVTLTRLTANPAAGTWELVHYLHQHDALQVLALRAAPARPAELRSPEGLARIALEVEGHFLLQDPAGRGLPLETLGAEPEGDTIAVYQETPAPARSGRYTVSSTLLHDLFAQQVNNVLVAVGQGAPLTLTLDAGHPSAGFAVGA